jgi:hypothetical protein
LGKFHAETTALILREAGYDEATIAEVESLLRKERLKTNPDCQLLEDVICLVFLQFYASEFADEQMAEEGRQEQQEEKLVNILRRTWKKMSPRGQQAALALNLPAGVRALVERALA